MSEWWYGLSARAAIAVGMTGVIVLTAGIWFGGNWYLDRDQGSDPDPVPSVSSVTPEAGESPGTPDEPSATATPANPAWEELTAAGGRAFALHWVEVFNKALTTGDTKELRSLSTKSCGVCTGFANFIEKTDARGGFYKTRGWQVVKTKNLATNQSTLDAFRLQFLRHGGQFKKTADSKLEKYSSDRAVYQMHMAWNGNEWEMTRMETALW
jgi:hypothetical protein